ncbi:hypothetical protein VPH35_046746 [Triticum aestivum]
MRETSTPLLFQAILRIRLPKCPRRRSSSAYSRATQREAGAEARNKLTRSGRGCTRISGHSSMPPLVCLCVMCYSKSLYIFPPS